MRSASRPFVLLAAAGVLLGLGGCSSQRSANFLTSYEKYDERMAAGDYAGALAEVRESREKGVYSDKDAFLLNYDLGMAHLYAGHTDSAVIYLRRAEDFAEEHYRAGMMDLVSATITSEINTTYTGEDHEVLMTTVMKALSFAADSRFEEAFTEARRTDIMSQLLRDVHLDFQEQYERELAQKGKTDLQGGVPQLGDFPYVDTVFGRYLGAHLYRVRGELDDARIDLDRIPPELLASHGEGGVIDLGDGGPVLSVIGLLGRAPVKEPVAYRVLTFPAKNVANVVVAGGGPDSPVLSAFLWPSDKTLLIKFEVPRIEVRPPLVQAVEVRVDGVPVGQLGLVESIGQVAEANFARKRTAIYLRTLLRVAAKAIVMAKSQDALEKDGDGGAKLLSGILGAVFNEISEAADIRAARLLPGELWARDIPIEPGVHDVEIVLYGPGGQVVGRDHYPEFEVGARDRWIVLPVTDPRKKGDSVASFPSSPISMVHP